jgi:hypothetical protein
MASVKECEKVRGVAEVKLNSEMRKLKKACTAAPNVRYVGYLVASLDVAYDNLVDSHVALVMKMNSELGEPRHNQFIERMEDAVEDVKAAALIIMQTTDNDGGPINQIDVGRLKEDYALTVLRMNTQVTALKAAVALPMNKEKHVELSKGGQELSDTLFIKFRDLCASLRKAMPGDAERLQEEHTEVLYMKAIEVDKLMVDLSAKKPADGPEDGRQQVPKGAWGGGVQPQEQREYREQGRRSS